MRLQASLTTEPVGRVYDAGQLFQRLLENRQIVSRHTLSRTVRIRRHN